MVYLTLELNFEYLAPEDWGRGARQATGTNSHGFEYCVLWWLGSIGGDRGLYEFNGYNKSGEMVKEKGFLTLEAATEMAENWKGE